MPKTKEVKFTDEELSKITEIQQNYNQIQASFGHVGFQRVILEQQLEQLNDKQIEA